VLAALLPLAPLLSPDPHPLSHWSGQGCTLSNSFPYLKFLARGLLIALMMEAASTSETSVNFYQTTRRSIPEDSHLLMKLLGCSCDLFKGLIHRFATFCREGVYSCLLSSCGPRVVKENILLKFMSETILKVLLTCYSKHIQR
jgi:hypothetical protein